VGERALIQRGNGKIWTDEESLQLEEIVKGNRQSLGLKGALLLTTEVLGRNLSSCKNHWYGKYAPPSKKAIAKEEAVLPAEPEKEETASDEPKRLSFIDRIEKSRADKEIPTQKEMGHEVQHFFGGANESSTEVLEPPYIKIEIKPITRAQLDCMTEAELFDLMLNLTIKMQELSNEKHADNRKLHRDLLTESSEKNEYKVGYTSLLGVINTARQMAVDVDREGNTPRFKMDSNGNLELIK
jgi:hypothetical protein